MKLTEFDYGLPQGLIAQYPLERRDASRMMVLDRGSREIAERGFRDIVEYLNEGDTVILNDVKVIPARLLGKKETGAKIELFLLERYKDNTYKALTKPSKRLKPGSKVIFKDNIVATVIENADIGKFVRFNEDPWEKLSAIGQVPLPPYIKRNPEESDSKRYQTIYGKHDGATASPTAGLHFTEDLLDKIKVKGVNIAYVTLNVSYGTFAPVLEEEIENHKMHSEFFKLPKETAAIINETKKKGKRIIAVGTTTARTLESCAVENRDSPLRGQSLFSREGATNLFIYPGYKFKVVDALLTNFHLPKSTLLMLVSAFAGREFILEAYRKAIEAKFRFFSYGDCMLIV